MISALQPNRRSASTSREGVLDAASFFVEAPVEAEWLLSVAAVGNDWLGSAILQPQTQLGAVVGLVGDQAFRCFAYGDEPLRDRAVMRFAAGQEDGEKTAPSICACMDLCVAPRLSSGQLPASARPLSTLRLANGLYPQTPAARVPMDSLSQPFHKHSDTERACRFDRSPLCARPGNRR
jgi:hypothetical protein